MNTKNFFNSKFTVSELIEELRNYNPDAYVVGVYDHVGHGMESLGYEGGDGCTKESCDDVSLHFGIVDTEKEE